jgi:hypothetical protein
VDNTDQFANVVDVESTGRKALSWADVVAKKKTDVKKMPIGISKLAGKQRAIIPWWWTLLTQDR